jgi:nicotinate-nucleotide pyrophosphorylase (carboxylating)
VALNPPLTIADDAIARVVALALAEDVGDGDVTTDAIVPAGEIAQARLLLEEPGVVAGLPVAEAVFRSLDPEMGLSALAEEGAEISHVPSAIAEIEGPARALLTGERVALNLVARLCGIATLTRRYVDLVAGTRATILDTRKTTPGLRALEKYAVRCGGGANHRMGLDDAILIKDNHVRIAGGIVPALAAVRASGARLAVEVEADTLDQVVQALGAGAERILLDNMVPGEVARAVELVDGRAVLEASGGISEGNVRAYAETGVDFISIGALTHGARSLHVSLEVT